MEDNKQAIISQIISAAEATAKSIVDAAQTEQNNALAQRAESDERKNSAALSRAEKNAEDGIKRSEMLARLDSKKNLLNVRQQAIGDVYLLVMEKLEKLPDAKYCDLFAGYIAEYAHDGDSISICKNDESRLNRDWLNRCAKQNNIKLDFAEIHNYRGGIIIKGKKCDINCTLEALISEARDKTEKKVAEILFGTNG